MIRKKLLIVAAVLPLAAAQELPEAPAKKLVEKICNDCHGVETVTAARRTKSGWETVVNDMVARGATGKDEEFDAIIAYLGRYWAKVNVNKADAQELQDVLEISAKDAGAIVHYRESNGAFASIDAVLKVPEIDAKALADRKDRIALN